MRWKVSDTKSKILNHLNDLKVQDVDSCKGIYFRGRMINYHKNGIIHSGMKFIELKKKSCKGCPKCDCLRELLNEIDTENPIIYHAEIDKGLYMLRGVEAGFDLESGICDEVELLMDYVEEGGKNG